MVDLEKGLIALADRIESLKENVLTEEATKHSFVMPFLQLLGYDVFDPNVIVPEFIADAGRKKHEKVDYAIMQDGEPLILIEVKKHSENLDNHVDQLFRYFSVMNNKFAILTNGIEYRFFTESETNRMDQLPFLQFSISDAKKREIKSLERFAKDALDIDKIMSLANKRKYVNGIKEIFEDEIENPSNEFVKIFASKLTTSRLTQPIMDEFKETVKSSFKEIIMDLANKKINAIKSGLVSDSDTEDKQDEEDNGIETTDEEIQGFFIVKSILAQDIELDKLVARDNKSYFGVLYEDNNRKWICRLHFNTKQKYIGIHETEKKEEKYTIEKLEDIYKYADKLKTVAVRYSK